MTDTPTTEPESRRQKVARLNADRVARSLAEHPELAAVRDAMLAGSDVLDGTTEGFVAHLLGVSHEELKEHMTSVGLVYGTLGDWETTAEPFLVSQDTFDEMCDTLAQPAKVNARLLDAAQTSRVPFDGHAGDTTQLSE